MRSWGTIRFDESCGGLIKKWMGEEISATSPLHMDVSSIASHV